MEVELDGKLELPDEHRTCIYRIVQEALTNSARHAGAKSIRVTVHGGAETLLSPLKMTVRDLKFSGSVAVD